MHIHHLRNATTLLTLGERTLLIDPMLSPPGAFPGFKMLGGGRRRNPLVPLPENAKAIMERATDVIITHEHPDHLDSPAIAWIRERGLPVYAGSIDVQHLRSRGLDARDIQDGGLEMPVEVIPAAHGRGIFGWLMGPVSGFYLAHPDEPSVYITADAVLTETVVEAVERLQPDVILAPAGSANFGLGSSIIFSVEELVALAKHASGELVFNHLESLDHCATTRVGLRERMDAEGVGERVHIPADGEALTIERPDRAPHVAPQDRARRKPGFQKWLTAKMA